MSDKSAFGTTARRALVWAIVAVVAIFAFNIVLGMVIGAVKLLFTLGLVLLIGYAVVWAVRRL